MAMTTLQLEVDRKADWQVLTVRGEVDVTTTPRVRAQLIALLSDGTKGSRPLRFAFFANSEEDALAMNVSIE